jgi:hypothetical protein
MSISSSISDVSWSKIGRMRINYNDTTNNWIHAYDDAVATTLLFAADDSRKMDVSAAVVRNERVRRVLELLSYLQNVSRS